MSARDQAKRAGTEEAVWQRVEFGSYVADLPLWDELAGRGGPVLELGAGWGRVSLRLARGGAAVTAVELDPELAEELAATAAAEGLPLTVLSGDAAELRRLWPSEARPVAVAIAPLHLVQQLSPEVRPTLLEALAALAAPGARIALTVVDEGSLLEGGLEPGAVPDMLELDGRVYSSEPLWVQLGEETLAVRRMRQRVGPDGAIERSVEDELLHRLDPVALEAEAASVGLAALERREIRSGPAEADSIAVILERP